MLDIPVALLSLFSYKYSIVCQISILFEKMWKILVYHEMKIYIYYLYSEAASGLIYGID